MGLAGSAWSVSTDGAFEILDSRVRRLNSEISRLERDLFRLRTYHGASGPIDMKLRLLIENAAAELLARCAPASVADWAQTNVGFTADRYPREMLNAKGPKTVAVDGAACPISREFALHDDLESHFPNGGDA